MAVYEWQVSVDVWGEIEDMNAKLENLTITEEEYAEKLMSMPGYPLTGLPQEGDDLRLTLTPKPSIYYNRKELN